MKISNMPQDFNQVTSNNTASAVLLNECKLYWKMSYFVSMPYNLIGKSQNISIYNKMAKLHLEISSVSLDINKGMTISSAENQKATNAVDSVQ